MKKSNVGKDNILSKLPDTFSKNQKEEIFSLLIDLAKIYTKIEEKD